MRRMILGAMLALAAATALRADAPRDVNTQGNRVAYVEHDAVPVAGHVVDLAAANLDNFNANAGLLSGGLWGVTGEMLLEFYHVGESVPSTPGTTPSAPTAGVPTNTVRLVAGDPPVVIPNNVIGWRWFGVGGVAGARVLMNY